MLPKTGKPPLCVELTTSNLTWIYHVCRAGVTDYPLVPNVEDTKGSNGTEQVTEHVKYNIKGKYLYTRWVNKNGECTVHQKSVKIPHMSSPSVTKMCIAEVATQLESVHEKNHADGVNALAGHIWEYDAGPDADSWEI